MINYGIHILMASFNGEKFIAGQIESILDQTYKNWQLFIRDDNSSDNTLGIIKNYQEKDTRIHLIEDNLGNLGSVQNFNMLLQGKKDSGHIMFCDQDDVWLPSKIEDTLQAMMMLEKKYSINTPLLVHTNFLFVDAALKTIESRKEFELTKIKNPIFSNVLCQNSAHGCTMMINKALKQITGSIPVEAENHDYWIALVASAFGKRYYLNKRTILYRQHAHNLSPGFNFNSLTNRFKRILIKKKNFEDVKSKLNMALVFKKIYYTQLSVYNKKVIDDFIALSGKRTLPLLFQNARNGVRRQTFTQTVLFYLTLIFLKKKPVHY